MNGPLALERIEGVADAPDYYRSRHWNGSAWENADYFLVVRGLNVALYSENRLEEETLQFVYGGGRPLLDIDIVLMGLGAGRKLKINF